MTSHLQSPFEELAKYQTIANAASSSGDLAGQVEISYDRKNFGVVSDKVKAASRQFANSLIDTETGPQSITDGKEAG